MSATTMFADCGDSLFSLRILHTRPIIMISGDKTISIHTVK